MTSSVNREIWESVRNESLEPFLNRAYGNSDVILGRYPSMRRKQSDRQAVDFHSTPESTARTEEQQYMQIPTTQIFIIQFICERQS